MKKILFMLLLVPFVSTCHSWDDALQLYFAAGSGETDTVQSILGQGIDPNISTLSGFTAL